MTQQPDILLFLSDDHGQWACSPYGHSELRTPVLQWLADSGARMDNAFTPSPVCSPARASFWTGKIPSAHGVHDYLKENPNNVDAKRHPGIEGQVNLAQLLQARGYRTGQFGKWHAGGGGSPMPGFDRWFSSLWGTGAGFREQCFSADGEEVRWFGHQAPEVMRRAIDFFRECKRENPEQPVFLVVGYTDTHTPHAGQSPGRLGPHERSEFPDIPRETFAGCHGDAFFPYDADSAEARAENRDYYAAVEWIDAQAGEVLEAVWAECALDEALVMYLSDHGHMNGHHGLLTEALDDLREGEVYLASGGDMRCAYWGELLTAAARTRGAVGAVVNGYHRDTPKVLEQDWPVFSRGRYCQDSAVRTQVTDFPCPIEVAGVWVEPGDLVFGDLDGVVVIPKRVEREVVTGALEKARGEKVVRQAIEQGMSATEAFATFGIL